MVKLSTLGGFIEDLNELFPTYNFGREWGKALYRSLVGVPGFIYQPTKGICPIPSPWQAELIELGYSPVIKGWEYIDA
jgi:hypothetical protein